MPDSADDSHRGKARPSWQLPPGVTRGMWEYAQAEHIARDYDSYFAHNRLFEFDEAVLARHFARPGVVVDLGAGTGRALVPLARRGFHGVAVDLSTEMLDVIGEKAAEEKLRIDRVLANMVELDCLADGMADYCMCLFSTLGMIRGGENRQRALGHVRRILKPGGRFVLHVHNFWYNLRDPGGPWWVLKSVVRALFSRDFEAGDKFFDYRQIPNMYLHVFRRRELLGALRRAGFRVVELIRLDPRRFRALRRPWFFGDLRANGWIVVCE
jgi:SAM-dependent methyltransferase